MTLASVLVGTRFKYFDRLTSGGSVRLPSRRRQCGERDSLAHLRKHMGETAVPTMPGGLIAFLRQLAIKRDATNPHVSAPYLPILATEIKLDNETLDGGSGMDRLAFDGDL